MSIAAIPARRADFTVMNTTVKLTPVQERLVAKLQAAGMEVAVPVSPQVRTNPYSGATCSLDPLAAALYDWIVSPSRGDNISAGRETRGLWDRARYLFLALWSEEYYKLID